VEELRLAIVSSLIRDIFEKVVMPQPPPSRLRALAHSANISFARWTRVGGGMFSMVFRLPCHGTLAAYSVFARRAYELVRDNDVLQQPPYDSHTLRAEQLASKWVSSRLFVPLLRF
jgi:hypothetical protein